MKVGSLFAGIGGFDLGLERAGMEVVWQVEIDPFCNKVLEKHWPNVRRYLDVKEVGKHNLEPVDLICGGFPCQPFSVAGKRRGTEDDRHLWPEMLRVITELQPRWVIGENVAGIGNMELFQICDDLEGEGYDVAPPFEIPAIAVGAPHVRFRWYVVAHVGGERYGFAKAPIFSGRTGLVGCAGWSDKPGVGGVVHGVPHRVDRIKALGNAVVPQVVEIIGRAIMEVECESSS